MFAKLKLREDAVEVVDQDLWLGDHIAVAPLRISGPVGAALQNARCG